MASNTTNLNLYKKEWRKQYFLKRKYWDINECILPILIIVAKITSYVIVIFEILKGNMNVGMLILVVGYIDRIETENTEFFKKTDAPLQKEKYGRARAFLWGL